MKKIARGLRLVLSIMGLIAIIAQMTHGLRYNGLVLSNFFSFFTIQSNILIVGVLLIGAMLSTKQFHSPQFQLVRGAVTTYIMTTGIVYFLFLRGMEAELQTTIPWVNFILHTLLPLYALFDWLAFPSRNLISFRRMWLWILYPLAYLVYTLLRGPLVDWYPYPFLDPRISGYGQVLISSIFITVLILLCSLIVVGSLKLRAASTSSVEVE
ncbi:integral membrane protein [Planococcus donghaensis MPA1U2]|uniref:Integral membrane protein n=1 Tax=Planococcus donghaensis MPA1U2 TaxID=933115 RepID=E7REG4_9BACL|nr:Pr6Pr family membrane protein [Planococcus donghaensis]EGA90545.1 integral membrane protein [Planococcus donghaensis MPA1U2]